jgi:hypothetical protein
MGRTGAISRERGKEKRHTIVLTLTKKSYVKERK